MTFKIKITEEEVKKVLEQHIRLRLMSNFRITGVEKVNYKDYYEIEGDNIPPVLIQNSEVGFIKEESNLPELHTEITS